MTHLVLNADEVRAILAGGMVTLHLPVKPETCLVDGEKADEAHWEEMALDRAWTDPGPSPAGNPGPYLKVPCDGSEYQHGAVHRVYARVTVGEEMWVKEAWAVPHSFDSAKTSEILTVTSVHHRASWHGPCGLAWRPAIHMPRWASRLTVTIEEVQFTMEPLAIYVAVRRKV